MLSAADDYPVHQLPEPVAFAGSDCNFYDRYYFQGYDAAGALFFGAALGVYPHLNLIDAAFMIQRDGVQHSLFASRHLDHERMDTRVGPIAVEVLEPLKRLRLAVSDADHDFKVALDFTGLAAPVEEPRFTYRAGALTVLDFTRMTQGGSWQGEVALGDDRIEVQGWRGVRDRSWGVRPLGERDSRIHAPTGEPQWYWLWAPLHFDDCMLFFHTNDDAQGRGWNRAAVLVSSADGVPQKLESVRHQAQYRPGTRQLARLRISANLPAGGEVVVELVCGEVVYKQGEGYNHPTWGHGMYQGAFATALETLDTRALDPNDFAQVHLHALCSAELRRPGEAPRRGQGVVEQMIVGAHAPSEFKGVADVAPSVQCIMRT